MATKPVILEGGDAPREQWLSDTIFNSPGERRIERSAKHSGLIEVYVWTGEREPVIETWMTRGGTEKSRVHQAPVFHFDHFR